MVPQIHSLITSLDASLGVDGLMPLEEIWRPVRRSDRFFVVALAIVSGIAMILSLAGIYALMSFTVAQRAREIAIRAALGAHPDASLALSFRARSCRSDSVCWQVPCSSA
jgi:ABC-type antimicrobial peptide transport system permease subunit